MKDLLLKSLLSRIITAAGLPESNLLLKTDKKKHLL
tara:strand:- start:442 stop:549 length:108 start_codon:yes stop_codon:yes gene_type:complete